MTRRRGERRFVQLCIDLPQTAWLFHEMRSCLASVEDDVAQVAQTLSVESHELFSTHCSSSKVTICQSSHTVASTLKYMTAIYIPQTDFMYAEQGFCGRTAATSHLLPHMLYSGLRPFFLPLTLPGHSNDYSVTVCVTRPHPLRLAGKVESSTQCFLSLRWACRSCSLAMSSQMGRYSLLGAGTPTHAHSFRTARELRGYQ